MKLAILAGGVGGARFVRAASAAVGAGAVTAIVNTADDEVFQGLHVSPDLDSMVYALAGEHDVERGWGLRDETFRAFHALHRFEPEAWFQLGDRDLGTHLFRAGALARGMGLAETTRRIAAGFGVRETVLPMTEQSVQTEIATDLGWLTFQQYHVRERSLPEVRAVRYAGAEAARPGPGVLEALAAADVALLAPSNPVSSIGPILAVAGIRAALRARRAPAIALSGLRGERPFRGDADRLLRGLGHEVSSLGVARLYREVVDGFVVDAADERLVAAIEALGLAARATEISLVPLEHGVRVVETCLQLAERIARDRAAGPRGAAEPAP